MENRFNKTFHKEEKGILEDMAVFSPTEALGTVTQRGPRRPMKNPVEFPG
jgi:hypothetical protein